MRAVVVVVISLDIVNVVAIFVDAIAIFTLLC